MNGLNKIESSYLKVTDAMLNLSFPSEFVISSYLVCYFLRFPVMPWMSLRLLSMLPCKLGFIKEGGSL